MIDLAQAKTWYQNADPVHDFAHIQRVYALAVRIGQAEQADMEILRAAVLLHDAEGSAPDSAERARHQHRSADFAAQVLAQEGWDTARIAAVQHCIRAHRFRGDGETPQTIEARVLFDADKLDVLGAIGAARVVAYAALNHQPFYATPSAAFLQTGVTEPGEPHSAYHEYLFKLSKIKDRLFTDTARAVADERDSYLTQFFQRMAAEWVGEK